MSDFDTPISEQIWDMKYRLKSGNNGPIDVTVGDTWRRIAGALADGENLTRRDYYRKEFLAVLEDGHFVPAGRIIAGAGTGRRVTLSNCFTMGTIPDDLGGIFDMLKEAALTMQQGGGIGYDFSPIRPKGAPVKGVDSDASGPLSFMDVWDAMCRTIMSAGSRRGAMMATMRDDHPDIMDFITAKKDPNRLRMFNVSVLVSDALMEAVKNDGDWILKHEVAPAGETERCEDGRWVHATIKARDLWNAIMESTYAQAEPGVIFIDRVNADHNLNYLETIATTNPCGEKPMGPYASCLLGSLNLARLVNRPFTKEADFDMPVLRRAVRTAIRMMDNVIEVGGFPLEAQAQKARDDRQLGLGVTGLADALIMLGITYGSEDAQRMTEIIMGAICDEAYAASIQLAQEKGPFPTFDADKFFGTKENPTFAGRALPEKTRERIRKHGIRNALLISIAPTGTISLFSGNVSSGIEPVFAMAYTRKVLQPDGSKTEERVVDYAVREYEKRFGRAEPLPDYFVTAQDLSPRDHLVMQAAAQKFVDSSISKTVNLPADISFEDFKAVYREAYDMGCKGCTTYRPNEITGSVLSADPEPEDAADRTRQWSDDGEFFNEVLRVVRLIKSVLGDRDAKAKVQAMLDKHHAGKIMQVAKDKRADLLDDLNAILDAGPEPLVVPSADVHVVGPEGDTLLHFDAVDAHIEEHDGHRSVVAVVSDLEGLGRHYQTRETDTPAARDAALPGMTYKVKFGADEHALYVTVNDIMEGGRRRPFEVFINSKSMEHYAWTVGLTRMISAVFRRPHDSRFVVEELKSVFDPKGGAWMNGKFVPSVLAAIGGVIEDHMKHIGYWDGEAPVRSSVEVADAFATVADELQDMMNVEAETRSVDDPGAVGPMCPKCFEPMKVESGCSTCISCGHSKCG
jgi:ribonucleoside-diphosphate reductase alpha chain